jgi:serine/threonine protein phosphatase 1
MTARIFAVGDIHGCNRELKRLIAMIRPDPLTDSIVFLGDYIDRGPDSRGVIDTLLHLNQTFPNLICLQGNHESVFLNYYLEGRDEELFFVNGGGMTLSSYGLTLTDVYAGTGFPDDHLRFLTSLSLYHETEAYLFVHAGLRPGVPLARQSPEDLLWIREEFIDSDWDFGKTIVFGHTPLREPLLQENKIGIDTGLVYGGYLTCIELPSRTIFQV